MPNISKPMPIPTRRNRSASSARIVTRSKPAPRAAYPPPRSRVSRPRTITPLLAAADVGVVMCSPREGFGEPCWVSARGHLLTRESPDQLLDFRRKAHHQRHVQPVEPEAER